MHGCIDCVICFSLDFIISCNVIDVSNIRSCCVGNLRVQIGDFVLINNADDPDRAESAYLAKLLDMFDNGKQLNYCYCYMISFSGRDLRILHLFELHCYIQLHTELHTVLLFCGSLTQSL